MSEVIKVTESDQLDALEHFPVAVVLFSDLTSCMPCKRFYPFYEKVSKIMHDLPMLYVDATTFYELLEKYDVKSVPSAYVFRNGEQAEKLNTQNPVAFAAEVQSL